MINALRRATGQRHHEIESLLRLDQALDMDRYRRILAGFDLFHSCWEPRIAAALPARLQGWFIARSRAALVREDLARIGGHGAAPSMADPTAGVRLGNTAAAFGSLYVVEGSALGGQVVAPMLADRLGLGPRNGAAYFAGFGAATGAMWREFRGLLEAEAGADDACVQAACEAARQTFDALIRTFREMLHEQPCIAC